jgi:hypothetical protein
MMEAVNIYETSVNFNEATQRDIQEASHLSSTRSTWCGGPTQSLFMSMGWDSTHTLLRTGKTTDRQNCIGSY